MVLLLFYVIDPPIIRRYMCLNCTNLAHVIVEVY